MATVPCDPNSLKSFQANTEKNAGKTFYKCAECKTFKWHTPPTMAEHFKGYTRFISENSAQTPFGKRENDIPAHLANPTFKRSDTSQREFLTAATDTMTVTNLERVEHTIERIDKTVESVSQLVDKLANVVNTAVKFVSMVDRAFERGAEAATSSTERRQILKDAIGISSSDNTNVV